MSNSILRIFVLVEHEVPGRINTCSQNRHLIASLELAQHKWGTFSQTTSRCFVTPPGVTLPGPQQVASIQKSISGMAIASLVLGILWLYWVGSILALVFGYMGRTAIDREPDRIGGRGLATAGIVLGWVGVSVLVVVIVVPIVMALTRSS